MKDSCRIYLVTESLTKCNIMLQFCKSTNSGKTIYLFCILFAFIYFQNTSMHPVGKRKCKDLSPQANKEAIGASGRNDQLPLQEDREHGTR